MAKLNETEPGLLWFCGLVAFAAAVMFVLLLFSAMDKLFSNWKDEFACRSGDTSCCQQSKPECGETKPVQPDDCVVNDAPHRELMLRHEIIVNPDNNLEPSRLIMKRPGSDLGHYVTESRLRAFILGKVICDGRRFAASGFIHFDRGKDALDGMETKKIRDFLIGSEQVKELWLFGFTSPDGEDAPNEELAKKRACAVRQEILKNFSGKINMRPIGEDSPINGIANSRSVVIAACWREPGEAEIDNETRDTAPPCPDPG